MREEGKPRGLPGPCPAALGMIGVPARRWLTKADLYAQLEKAKSFMDSCALDSVSVASCADAADMSLHHFLRLFHEVHGQTPHQYLAKRRICFAKQMLEDSDLSISQIAVEVGFGGVSSFGRMFRQEVGCSPTQYRAKLVASPSQHQLSKCHSGDSSAHDHETPSQSAVDQIRCATKAATITIAPQMATAVK